MKKYNLSFTEEETPKYIQISKYFKKLIDENFVEDGEKLPSIRELSKSLLVNNATIVNAYKRLESEGYAVQKIGSGTYAKKKENTKSFNRQYSEILKKLSNEQLKSYIDFAGETTSSEFFPVSTFKKVLNEVLDRDGSEALIYQDSLGYSGLRSAINQFFWKNEVDLDSILIVSGAQQGIDIISKALLNVNDSVIVEQPTYSGALTVFKWRRVNILEVPIEKDGVDLKAFEKILKKNKVKLFYTMSYFQNPSTITCSLEKKLQILTLAEKYDFHIVEDDYLSELIYNSNIEYKSFRSLDKNDRVIYIKSFSKIFLPGIRIGYLITPEKLKEVIQNSKINTDIATSSLMQRALELYIRNGYWREHINNINDIYSKRYDYMKSLLIDRCAGELESFFPGGGLNFYLKIKEEIDFNCKELFFACLNKKVLITPGVIFYKNPSDGHKFFRISFSQTSTETIERGLNIISEILKMH
ncbi:MAG: PLP-dependent aminotransferase family protein [Clostridiaceae bacterium]|nr:PLP-dependent aminotransferase family protein [Clostridiaceae bacterium]